MRMGLRYVAMLCCALLSWAPLSWAPLGWAPLGWAPSGWARAASTGSSADEAAVRAVLAANEDASFSPGFDWENAFGVRYTDPAKMRGLLSYVHGVLQARSTRETLETRIAFLTPDMAVADRYDHVTGQIDQRTGRQGADRWIRATTILQRTTGGRWTEVLERVADLRLPYYRHFTSMPPAAPVPAATLLSYAGTYLDASGKGDTRVSAAGDRLRVVLDGKTRVAVPSSPTDFLVFDPADLERYARLRFGQQSDGRHTALWSSNTGEPVGEPLVQAR